MKHGSMVMTLRLSSSRRSGSRQIYRRRKKRVKFATMSSPCWSFFFSTSRSLSTRNSHPLVKQSMASFTVRFLKRLREGIRRKRPDKWKKNNWFLHHDNAPAHTSLVVRQFLTSKNITMIPPPFHSPDLAPCDFFLFPKMKLWLKGVVLKRLRRSTQKRKRLSTHSHFRNSRDAWNHGKHAGIAVYMLIGATSKETVEARIYGKKLYLHYQYSYEASLMLD